uniref:Retrotransposon protein n=1 Tax=Tanacetum cinerariifolium TaxID=118510 RepID=A0A6L2LSZ7_TANCI|nr:retrotransposon protein [Tanacetum cinerariifolium]
MEYVMKSIDKRALKREYDNRVNERQMQTTEGKVDTSNALDASLVDTKSSGIESREQNTSSSSGMMQKLMMQISNPYMMKSQWLRQMQTTEGKVDTSNAFDASLVDTKSIGIESREQNTSSSSGMMQKLMMQISNPYMMKSQWLRLKALDEGYSSKNYVRKFLRGLHPKWRAKVKKIEESKDLTSLSLDDLIGSLNESSDDGSLTFGSEDEEYGMAVRDFKKLFKRRGRIDLEPDEWIKDSGFSKHMKGHRKLFSTYKAYNRGNVIFGSNLRGNIIGKGHLCDSKCKVTFKNDSKIVKDGKVIGRGIRKRGLYVMKLRKMPEDKICLAMIDENSILWHRRLGHANMRLIQSLASKD